ncbi:MAG: hypothetical protein ACE5FZ_09425 [Nitrospiria bacterium]
MTSICIDQKKEASLFHHMKQIRPYLDEALDGIEWSDLKGHLRESRSERRFRRGRQ